MYDDLRRRTPDDRTDRDRVHAVHDHRLGAHRPQPGQFGRASRRRHDAMPLRDQLRHQSPTKRSARTRYEDIHDYSLRAKSDGSKTKGATVR